MSSNNAPESVLLYGYGGDDQESRDVHTVFSALNVPCREILGEEAGQSVGVLAGLDAPAKPAELVEAPAGKAMIFVGFTEQRLRQVIAKLREDNAGTGSLKAMLTPHNRGWRFCDLLSELEQERIALLKMRRK